ncbi:MAG: hypothetical protein JSR37_08645 [Verrucomicrobia bacterium]|nr:hypothetical protein [Verrucomicrobiota bacterium]MBS0637966.1 hypothetical protein [Verrucomicrobiota bacterium]
MSLYSNLTLTYMSYKQRWDEHSVWHPDSPLSIAYTGLGRVVEQLTTSPLVAPAAPEKPSLAMAVTNKVQKHLPKITAAFGFATAIFQPSWFFNAGSSLLLQKFTHKSEVVKQEIAKTEVERRVTHDAAIAMCALHTLKFGRSVYVLCTAPSLNTAAGLVYDGAAALMYSGVAWENRLLPPKLQEKPPEKKE